MKATEVLHYFLSEDGEKHWHEIQKLATDNSEKANTKLEKYFMEALRLNSQQVCKRTVKEDVTSLKHGKHPVEPKQDVMLLIVSPLNLSLISAQLYLPPHIPAKPSLVQSKPRPRHLPQPFNLQPQPRRLLLPALRLRTRRPTRKRHAPRLRCRSPKSSRSNGWPAKGARPNG